MDKRILSLLLIITVLFSLISPTFAAAQSTPNQDESFRDDSTLTKNENSTTEINSDANLTNTSTVATAAANPSAIMEVNIKPDTAPFNIGNDVEDISTMTGTMSLKYPDITLPGRNGLSFTLTRMYDTNDASYFDPFVVYKWSNDGDLRLFNERVQKPSQAIFPIGVGWSWNIPYIYSKTFPYPLDYGTRKYIHLPEKGTYEISNGGLQGYQWKDLEIKNDGTDTLLHSINDNRDYRFNANGLLIKISDAYQNEINFTYESYNGGRFRLKSIADSLNNMLNIKYVDDTNTNQVILTYGNRTVVYNLSTMNYMNDSGVSVKQLNSVIDQENRQTSFEYKGEVGQFNLVHDRQIDEYTGYPYNDPMPFLLMKSITHPTQGKTNYEYFGEYQIWAGRSGFYPSFRTKSREDSVTENGVPTVKNHKDITYLGGLGTQSSYGSSFNFETTIKDTLQTDKYTNSIRYYGGGSPPLLRSVKIENQFDDEKDGQKRTILKSIDYGYTQLETYNVPNVTTVRYKEVFNGNTSYSQDYKTTNNYDLYGNVIDSTNVDGAKTTYTYSSSTHWLSTVSEQVTPNNNKNTAYTRNSKGSITDISVTDSTGTLKQHLSYDYDSFGNKVTTKVYDDNNKVYEVTDSYESLSPNYGGFLTKRTYYSTDADGLRSQITQKADYYTYSGEVSSYEDGSGIETTFLYDKLDRLTKKTFKDNSFEEWIYDDNNNKVTYMEPHFSNEEAVVFITKWNELGWKTSEGIEGNGTIRYNYDAYGRQTQIKDAEENITESKFDPWNRLIQYKYPDGFSSDIYYDDIKNQQITADGEGHQVRETFDVKGRVKLRELKKKEEVAFAKLASYTYDYLDNLMTSEDSKSKAITYSRDILGRINSVLEPVPLSNLTKYTYSLAGNLTQIQYAGDNSIVEKQYDEAGRLIKKSNTAQQVEKYYYNGNNQLTKREDRNGVTTEQQYNNRNQLWKQITPTGTVEYTYTSSGKRKTMKVGNETTTNYDYYPKTGQLMKVTYPDDKKITYTYDGTRGNVQTVTDPFGTVSAYGYDKENRLKGVGPALNDWDESYETPNSYNKNNLLMESVQRNGITTSYSYDWVRMNSITHKRANGDVVNQFNYVFDLNNNITSKKEKDSSNESSYSYTYDADNRISTASQFDEVYTYDARGNRSTYQSNSLNGIQGVSYEYDDRNRLQTVTSENGTNVSYKYDGDGLLYERSENGETTRYYFNGSQLIAEGSVNGDSVTMKASYIYGHGLVARVDASKNKTYYLKNGHGDIIGVQDASGNPMNSYSYDIWGNPLVVQESVPQPFRYSGEYWDDTTQLQYLRARWYDPSIGRFINEDTYEGQIDNPLTLNLYTYAANNPIKYNDPTGHFFDIIADIGFALYDTYQLVTTPSWENAGYLALDVGSAFVPFVTGTGAAVRTAVHADDFLDGVKATDEIVDAAIKGCNCFTAGTKVQTDEAEKNIEDIEVGDRVLSKDEKTGEVAYREVTATFNHETDEIYKILVGGQTIESTFNHPFYVEGKGWTFVKDLKIGDMLVQSDGNTLKIDSIELEHKNVTVYNMTVEEFHTYFVSGLGIWVHNTSCGFNGNSKASMKPQHGYEISETTTGKVAKTGISGQPLNKNGSSPRANQQINSWNKMAGYNKYKANVVQPSIANRQDALNWEMQNAQRLWDAGQPMDKHIRPRPWE
ncbi:polymorphic toxin-type HINT domain-containing protein [Paenibacillus oryzisoli]|uniref:Hint domain-containing protein n=1 Tax=Paenibacillus oryzisoli TaxID=1850517 RepID=A0A198A0R4_9BACL|nr:polymorphic toxin-type HINT domain-containing protein [Paenibacillus oryzisoli]OAS14692.1 hypothetical protein A8708_23610 [Paenibacillus oryzisoli]